jgi:hypothetical protein
MKTRSIRLILFGIVPIALSILSCSSTQLFASPTPTPTNTATITPTSTTTPTATPVPPPPFTIEPCVFEEDCPQANLVTTYLDSDLQTDVQNRIVFPFEDKLRLNKGWCAKDETFLAQNMEHIHYIFEIDGISYLDYATIKTGYWWEDDPADSNPCTFIGAMLSDFEIDQKHLVIIGFRFDAEVNDGWESFAPFTGVVQLELIPAYLPTPTNTETPTPTNTPRPLPTIPYYTATPACAVTSKIDISNTTGGIVTLYLKGPASFMFYVSQGDSSLSVCSGTYSYTAYGCGGASDTGTMSSGESHEFFCQ